MHSVLLTMLSLVSAQPGPGRLDAGRPPPPSADAGRAEDKAALELTAEPLRYVALCPDGHIIARYDGRSVQPLVSRSAPDSDEDAPAAQLTASIRERLGLHLWHAESRPLEGTPFPRPAYRRSRQLEGDNSDSTIAGGVFLGAGGCRGGDVVLSDYPFARVSMVAQADRSALETVIRALGISWPVSDAVVTTPSPVLAVLSGGVARSRHRAVVQLAPSPRVLAHERVHEDEMGTYGRFDDAHVFRWNDGVLFFTWQAAVEDAKSPYPGAYTTSRIWVGVLRPGSDAMASPITLAVNRGG